MTPRLENFIYYLCNPKRITRYKNIEEETLCWPGSYFKFNWNNFGGNVKRNSCSYLHCTICKWVTIYRWPKFYSQYRTGNLYTINMKQNGTACLFSVKTTSNKYSNYAMSSCIYFGVILWNKWVNNLGN